MPPVTVVPGDIADALSYRAEDSPGALDVALDVIGTANCMLEPGAEAEPFRKMCPQSPE